MIVEKTQPLINYKEYLSKNLQNFVGLSKWTDYQWQLNNSIKTIGDFENFTAIKFTKKEHIELEKTINKFPLSITPYYASLINTENYTKRSHLQAGVPKPSGTKNFKVRHERPSTRRQRQPNQRNYTSISRPSALLNQQPLCHVL